MADDPDVIEPLKFLGRGRLCTSSVRESPALCAGVLENNRMYKLPNINAVRDVVVKSATRSHNGGFR